ncbi:hypothetical protein [Roseibium marinum]|uniref:Uncharacterized protein n=1 Tax=Roseibium marinum TaxID=281252 RepID=A0A2S3UQP9_9HYPH|nr:hypothetical protein [Roseibium marinum]POF30006.1 hypothetical protein CLV41_10731 [Roseibium marinum]
MEQSDVFRETGLRAIAHDPSLLLALGTGSALTVFLLLAHSCCLGLAGRHLAPLLQICSFAA